MITNLVTMVRKEKQKRETDSYSTMSSTSRGSIERKPRRFSLRRIFRTRTLSAKSNKSRGSLEVETGSDFSFNTVHMDKELTGSLGQSLVTADSLQEESPTGSLVCPICINELPLECFLNLMTCHHRCCMDCFRTYLKIEITESRVNISCPECSERLHPSDIQTILNNKPLMEKYEEFMLRRVLVSDPDARWCPAPDCGFAVIAAGCAGCPKIKCERPGCGANFCYHCKQYWHPNLTCDAARARRSPTLRSGSIKRPFSASDGTGECKPCPRCATYICKLDDGSCNHMTCSMCGAEFCWLCLQEISDLHYLSPSGCTFWGKKPWSRKKKILWQLGTLVGAPVGIGLIAGIAVPAMIIGIPIWVGRKIHAKYENSPRHKRNVIIAAGVTGSIIGAPIIAGLAVGIGVPILLAYVYGVVPISLCRGGGGCGLSTTESGGVRFDFDDDNDVTVGVSGAIADTQSIEINSQHAVTEPSIGPSIGEASVDMTKSLSASGSHVDRIGVIRDTESDRDSASNRAIAGTSLNGSLSGSAVLGNRLEVHADVTNAAAFQKRSSFSSESANFSLSEKSNIVAFSDDISTKALAGSIGGQRDNMSSIIPPIDGNTDYQRRRNSGSSNVTVGSHHRVHSNNASPVSGRSVSFNGDENKVRRPNKKFKRRSFNDRYSTDNGEKMDKLSIGSCDLDTNPDPTETLCLPVKVPTANDDKKSSPRSSTSYDSCDSRVAVLQVTGLTEVESDKPQYNIRTINKSIPEDNTLVEGPVLCNIVEEQKVSSGKLTDNGARRQRRKSCELAMDQGRLSPDKL